MNYDELKKNIILHSTSDFESLIWEVFAYQYAENALYKAFATSLLGGSTAQKLQDIPFLPISFFKSHEVKCGDWSAEVIYKSSATTGVIRSKHFVKDDLFYKQQALSTFEKQYGSIKDYCIFGLLPGYLERGDSSLIAMTDYFIKESACAFGGFYLDDIGSMKKEIKKAKEHNKKVLLLGVSYALWELIHESWNISDVIFMETGGMKGKGPELPKPAFHTMLEEAFQVSSIHSEYGMTELMSQAYSQGNQRFFPADTMKIQIRDVTDPLTDMGYGKSGIINIIDLANIDTCSFIATEDLGIVYEDGSFEVLGRVDAAEIRGCNLLVSDL